MQLSFEDRTYLVTGGGSGIGKGVAAGLVASGASVMIVGRNADRLAAAVEEIDAVKASGGAIRYEPADVTNEDEVTRAVEAATAWHGRLHGAVHCAGGSLTIGPITQIDSERVATHRRPERQRHHVRAQALRRAKWCAAEAGRSSASRRSRPATPIAGSVAYGVTKSASTT